MWHLQFEVGLEQAEVWLERQGYRLLIGMMNQFETFWLSLEVDED